MSEVEVRNDGARPLKGLAKLALGPATSASPTGINGFAVLEVQQESLAVISVGGEELYRYRITTATTQ
jgi:hypothetical protein